MTCKPIPRKQQTQLWDYAYTLFIKTLSSEQHTVSQQSVFNKEVSALYNTKSTHQMYLQRQQSRHLTVVTAGQISQQILDKSVEHTSNKKSCTYLIMSQWQTAFIPNIKQHIEHYKCSKKKLLAEKHLVVTCLGNKPRGSADAHGILWRDMPERRRLRRRLRDPLVSNLSLKVSSSSSSSSESSSKSCLGCR